MADVVDAMPPVQCLTAEPVSANAADQANKNPMEPRRYFVKTDLLRATLLPPSVTERTQLWPAELVRRTRIRRNSAVTL